LASNLIELLRQFESILKTAVVHESGGTRGTVKRKKTEGRKSRETVPVNIVQKKITKFAYGEMAETSNIHR
jgi:hypothetical protein